jgi:hypothetical protein
MVANNQQHIFYRTDGGSIWHVFWDPSSGQHKEQWAGAGGVPHLGPDAAGDPATMVANNQQHIFYRMFDGEVWHVLWDPDPNKGLLSERWAGPGSSIGAPAAAGDPITMVANNQQHIFYRGTDDRLYHVFWDPNHGLSWEHWTIGLPGWVPPWP